VSIAWRVAAVEIELLRSVKPSLADKVGAALGIWRSYLLSERHDAGAYEHHIFILDYITGATGRTLIPPKTHFYLLRGVDATLVYSSGIVYVYAKLPGVIFLSGIEPPKIEGMSGTRVRRRGVLASPQKLAFPGFGEFLVERIRIATQEMGKISDRQLQKTLELALRNPDRVLASESYKAFLADDYWRQVRRGKQ
jgi:hypothetical protein